MTEQHESLHEEPRQNYLLNLARLGEPTVLTQFLNEALGASGVTARVHPEADWYRIRLGTKAADEAACEAVITQIMNGLHRLGLPHVEEVRFEALVTGDAEPVPFFTCTYLKAEGAPAFARVMPPKTPWTRRFAQLVRRVLPFTQPSSHHQAA